MTCLTFFATGGGFAGSDTMDDLKCLAPATGRNEEEEEEESEESSSGK